MFTKTRYFVHPRKDAPYPGFYVTKKVARFFIFSKTYYLNGREYGSWKEHPFDRTIFSSYDDIKKPLECAREKDEELELFRRNVRTQEVT